MSSERIQEAVKDPEWQKFRLSLKGLSTEKKLAKLRQYYEEWYAREVTNPFLHSEPCNICTDQDEYIRVDNYIKALCRGGQLFKGESLESMIRCNWDPDIKS